MISDKPSFYGDERPLQAALDFAHISRIAAREPFSSLARKSPRPGCPSRPQTFAHRPGRNSRRRKRGVRARGEKMESEKGADKDNKLAGCGGDDTRPDDLLLIRDSQRTAQLGS